MLERLRSRRVLLAVLLFVVVAAAALRLPGLTDKPLHSDEGVNGWFTLRLYWWNLYRYQASDYHGPFLYYVNLVFFWLFGATDVSLRIGTALAGMAIPVALLPARRWLGSVGLLVSGLLLAAGPCLVYFARTCIHETYLIAFTALWAAALARYAQRPALRWGLLAAFAAFGCFSNKETAIITAGSLGVGAGLAWLVGRSIAVDDPEDPDLFGGRGRADALRAWLGAWRVWIAGVGVFAVLIVLFFSSFFTFSAGVGRFFEAYTPWLEYGTTGRNQTKPWTYFWKVMGHSQQLAVYPALAAGLWALVRRHRVGLMLLGWGASAFAVYSLVPYKTPWCVLNIDLPAFLLCGWGSQEAVRFAAGRALPVRAVALVLAASPLVALPGLVGQSIADNTEHYDDGKRPYVYVQTVRGMTELFADVVGVARNEPGGDGGGPGVINLDAKNPTRWYLITRGLAHDRHRYVKKTPKRSVARKAGVLIATGAHKRKAAEIVAEEWGAVHVETYDLRPGWTVQAHYRQELWDAYQAAGGREANPWPIAEEPTRPAKLPKKYRKKR